MEGGFSGADVSELIPYLSSIDSSVDTVVARFDSLLTVAQSIEAGVWVLAAVLFSFAFAYMAVRWFR